MYKKFLFTTFLFLFSFIFIGNVKADDLIMDKNNAPLLTRSIYKSDVQHLAELANIDTSVYDTFFVYYGKSTPSDSYTKFGYFFINLDYLSNGTNYCNVVGGSSYYAMFPNGTSYLGRTTFNIDSIFNDSSKVMFNRNTTSSGWSLCGSNAIYVSYLGSYAEDPPPYADFPYIDVPISDLYDSDNQAWVPFYKYFKSLNDDNSYNFYVDYINDDNSNLPTIPLELFIDNDVVNVEDYQNAIINSNSSSASGQSGGFSFGGGSFGGGSGGGRFTDESSCLSTSEYSYFTDTLFSDTSFGYLTLKPNSCFDISEYTPSDFKTQYIRIYYDVSFYSTFDDVIDDYLNSIDDVINGGSFGGGGGGSILTDDLSIKSALNYFVSPIREIMRIFTSFYNALPSKAKVLLISLFVISIYLVVIRFIL